MNLYDRKRLERREVVELLDDMYRAAIRVTAIRLDDIYTPERSSNEKVFQDVILVNPSNAGVRYDIVSYAPPGCPDEPDRVLATLELGRDIFKCKSITYRNKTTNIYRGSVNLRYRVKGGNQQWLLLIYK